MSVCQKQVTTAANHNHVLHLAVACFQANLPGAPPRQAAQQLPTKAPKKRSVYRQKYACNYLLVLHMCMSSLSKPAQPLRVVC